MAKNYEDMIRKVCSRTMELLLREYEDEETNRDSRRWSRWDWSAGVAFYGMWQAYELMKDESLPPKMKGWLDARIENGIDSININTTSPMLVLFSLYQNNPEKRYEQIMRFFDQYLAYFGLRTPCGALSHTVIGKHRPGQIWADTLFMGVLYLARRGIYLHNEYYVKEAVRNILLHAECLLDKETNLFYHGWHDEEKKHMGVKWGRGNAWITASIVDILEAIGSEFDEKNKILNLLGDQVKALSKIQDQNGLWRTVLDDPESYPEVSVTAGVAYGVLKGIRLGYIQKKYKEMALKAINAVVSNIDAEGTVLCASGGTRILENAEEYKRIPYAVTPFSQGLAIMALCEGAISNNP